MVDKNDKRIFGYSLINVLNHSIPIGTILFISKAGLIMSLDLYVCPNVIKSKLKFSWLDRCQTAKVWNWWIKEKCIQRQEYVVAEFDDELVLYWSMMASVVLNFEVFLKLNSSFKNFNPKVISGLICNFLHVSMSALT